MKMRVFSHGVKRYNELKKQAEKRENSTYYGLKSIMLSSLAVVCAFASMFLQTSVASSVIGGVLILVLLVLVAYIFMFGFALHACFSAILQLKLNRKAIGWFAIIVLLLSTYVSVLLIMQ